MWAANGNATAGTAVATPPSVIVKDVYDNPVSGISVTFGVASGGGSISGPVALTNASGIAAVGSWTLGIVAGANSLTATAAGLNGSPVILQATGVAGPAAHVAISAGNGQTGTSGRTVAITPSVLVTDANGNPVSGVTVTFAVASGGGFTANNSYVTDVNGLATVRYWVLGNTAGSNSLTATVTGLAPVTFTATGTPDLSYLRMTVNAGNGQVSGAGTAVATAPSVLVADGYGNPVSGFSVTFAVAAGGGGITGGSATTNASGIATVGSWTLGLSVCSNALTATAAVAGLSLTFTASTAASCAAHVAISAGNGQTAFANYGVPISPKVLVTDANGNPVTGVTVTFAVASGGGFTVNPVTTDVNGLATAQYWILGTAAGSNTLTATVTGLAPVTFTATGTPDLSSLRMTVNGGNGQVSGAGTAVATAPSVRVADQYGNPASGISVTFAVVAGGGGITGGSVTTNASGIATVGSWTLGVIAGTNSLTATSGTMPGSPITINATGAAGAATQIAIAAGNGQTANAGTFVVTPPSVIVRDVFGNPVSGVTVTFAVTSGSGAILAFTVLTDATGRASVGGWALGGVAGPNTLTATASGLSGSPVLFTATGR